MKRFVVTAGVLVGGSVIELDHGVADQSQCERLNYDPHNMHMFSQFIDRSGSPQSGVREILKNLGMGGLPSEFEMTRTVMRFTEDGFCQTGAIPWTLDPRLDESNSEVREKVERIAADYEWYLTRYSQRNPERFIGDSIWQAMDRRNFRQLSERDYNSGISFLDTLLDNCKKRKMHRVESARDSAADCRRIVTNPFTKHQQTEMTHFQELGNCLYEHKEDIDMSALNGLAAFHIIFQDNERVAFSDQISPAELKTVRDSCNRILAVYSFAIDPDHGHTQGTADWCHQMKHYLGLSDGQILSRIDAIKKVVTRTARFPAHRSIEYSFLLSVYWLNVLRAFWPSVGDCIKEADVHNQLEVGMAENVAFGHAFDRLITGLTTGTKISSKNIPIVWNFIFMHSRYGFIALLVASILLNQDALASRSVGDILKVIADPFAFTPEERRDKDFHKWLEFADLVLQSQLAVRHGTVLTFHQVVDIVDVLVDSVMDSSDYSLDRIPDTAAPKSSTSFFESIRESLGL